MLLIFWHWFERKAEEKNASTSKKKHTKKEKEIIQHTVDWFVVWANVDSEKSYFTWFHFPPHTHSSIFAPVMEWAIYHSQCHIVYTTNLHKKRLKLHWLILISVTYQLGNIVFDINYSINSKHVTEEKKKNSNEIVTWTHYSYMLNFFPRVFFFFHFLLFFFFEWNLLWWISKSVEKSTLHINTQAYTQPFHSKMFLMVIVGEGEKKTRRETMKRRKKCGSNIGKKQTDHSIEIFVFCQYFDFPF